MKHKSSAFSLIELSIVVLIIGILIAGVLQGSKLLSKFRILTAQTITKSSPVSSIKDLTLWLETTGNESFINASGNYNAQDGEAISSWNDSNPQILYKKVLLQNNSSSRPVYKSEGINNLPSLAFDGTDDFLRNTSQTVIGLNDNHYTIFTVFRSERISSSADVLFYQGVTTECAKDYAGVYLNHDGIIYGWGCGTGGDTASAAYIPYNSYGVVYRVDAQPNSTTSNIEIYVNGAKTSAQKQGLNVGNSAGIGVGSGVDQFYFKGLISEVIVYNRALTEEEISAVRSYLTKKYGFAI